MDPMRRVINCKLFAHAEYTQARMNMSVGYHKFCPML